MLLDHGEEVAEQGPLIGGQLAGDGVGAGRARAAGGLADAGVPAALDLTGLETVGEGPVLAGAG
ncbi:MAG: hypothetical protein ACJ75S_00075 [Solirubrobacterales bacterium]